MLKSLVNNSTALLKRSAVFLFYAKDLLAVCLDFYLYSWYNNMNTYLLKSGGKKL